MPLAGRAARTGVFGPQPTLFGLVAIGHEIAHTQGASSEADAECRGIVAALAQMQRLGMSGQQLGWASTG